MYNFQTKLQNPQTTDWQKKQKHFVLNDKTRTLSVKMKNSNPWLLPRKVLSGPFLPKKGQNGRNDRILNQIKVSAKLGTWFWKELYLGHN